MTVLQTLENQLVKLSCWQQNQKTRVILAPRLVWQTPYVCTAEKTSDRSDNHYFARMPIKTITLNSLTFSMVISCLDVWLESVCSQLLTSFRHGCRGIISSVYLEEINRQRATRAYELQYVDQKQNSRRGRFKPN